MAVSKAQQKAVAKYMKENYDNFQLRMPKGKKAIIKDFADKQGETMNSFINKAVDEKMQRDEPALLKSAPDGAELEENENADK